MGKPRQETRKGKHTSWHPVRATRLRDKQHEEHGDTSALQLVVPLLTHKRKYTEGLTIELLFCPQT